jgi:hypothetical protein
MVTEVQKVDNKPAVRLLSDLKVLKVERGSDIVAYKLV